MRLRSSVGCSTTASPRNERISPISHSSPPTGTSSIAERSLSLFAPGARSSRQRATSGEYQTWPALARHELLVLQPRAPHPVEPEGPLTVPGAVPRVHVPVRQLALHRIRLDQVGRGRLLALLQVVELDKPPFA